MRDWMPVLFCGLSVPLSLFMWLGNVAVSRIWTSDFEGERSSPGFGSPSEHTRVN